MCGIAGVVEFDRQPDAPVMELMLQSMRHRGPDDQRVYVDGVAALGHARLSIIDLSGGAQPMCNEDGSLWIVFNGEIFNYLELRAELIASGHSFRTRSDTEVILHLFEDLEGACVSRLNGQWAFAIWNACNRSLFLSRDRVGVRPLFYCHTGNSFLFASEIKALFANPAVRRELDVRAIDEIFTFWHTVPPRTAFVGVSELPPGHSATVSQGRLSVAPYWDIDYSHAPRPRSDGWDHDRALGEELLWLLKDATRLRLRSDVPVGAYLSGGLDSTLIAALIKESGVARLTTFSVRFEDTGLDEGPYQMEAVRHLGTDHLDIRCSADSIAAAFPDVVWHAEQPLIRTAPAPLYLLSGLVHDNSYKVVLTGEGSDEMLGGYDIFKEAKVRAFCLAQPQSRKRPLLLRRLYPYMPQLRSQPTAYLEAFFRNGQGNVEDPFFSHIPRWRLTSKLKGFFSDRVKAELSGRDAVDAVQSRLPEAFGAWDLFARAQYLETRYLLPGYILSSQGDRVAMAHSVEGRFPFLDHRVAEFASRLPAHLKMNVLKEKYLLKQISAGLVPPAIAKRPKQPYRAPDAQCFFGGSRIRPYVEELLDPTRLRRDDVFNAATVQKLVAKARRGDIIGIADNMAVVGILSTQMLIDRFITNYPHGNNS